ncbi:AtpZ/AtpI family protein [Hazenella coriacea]|uniref:Putative F0F1-ATPase subunit (Ca2+/Mg2+ transporter) n=1 Tax=Hazenella coriacea TaxID=1179467 RepID=A0A4R3L8R9_9BACL|nr:AtpZ/AtpI family protein [Hazenella coriacea]TCS95588.1 putative F0F1-ATPase subunit (Ca2+/Mg2+ transporter) [Hazenella coriacea]
MSNKGNPLYIAATIGSMGMEVLISTVGGAWLGKWLDQMWGTKPILILVGFLLGLTLGFVSAFYTFKALIKD